MKGKTSFDRLLKRYLRDRIADEEKTTFEAWLDTDKTDTKESFVWEMEDERKLFQKITGNIDRHERMDGWWMTMRLMNPLPVGQRIKMAATILLMLTASYGVWDSFKDTLRKSDRVAGCHLKKFLSFEKRHGARSKD